MNDCYSPHTGEHIATDTPADWMGRAGFDAPDYDRVTQGCFFRDGTWVIVDSADPAAQLLANDLKALSAEYKADTLQLNLDWLTAMVNDGATETAKKAAIVQKRADRLAKLTADMSAAKLKYA